MVVQHYFMSINGKLTLPILYKKIYPENLSTLLGTIITILFGTTVNKWFSHGQASENKFVLIANRRGPALPAQSQYIAEITSTFVSH